MADKFFACLIDFDATGWNDFDLHQRRAILAPALKRLRADPCLGVRLRGPGFGHLCSYHEGMSWRIAIVYMWLPHVAAIKVYGVGHLGAVDDPIQIAADLLDLPDVPGHSREERHACCEMSGDERATLLDKQGGPLDPWHESLLHRS